MIYSLLSSRAVQDLKLVPLVFDALGLEMTRRDVLDLLDRLTVIHDRRHPVTVSDLVGPRGEHG